MAFKRLHAKDADHGRACCIPKCPNLATWVEYQSGSSDVRPLCDSHAWDAKWARWEANARSWTPKRGRRR